LYESNLLSGELSSEAVCFSAGLSKGILRFIDSLLVVLNLFVYPRAAQFKLWFFPLVLSLSGSPCFLEPIEVLGPAGFDLLEDTLVKNSHHQRVAHHGAENQRHEDTHKGKAA
jgi:hypothetical protein